MTPLLWLRGLRARLARTRRYLQILTIAVRHGLGPYLRGRDPATAGSRTRLARSLRQALLMSNGSPDIFVKRPISAALLAVAVAFVAYNVWAMRRKRIRSTDQPRGDADA